ncbi:hypothetical protein BJ166DRAFT_368058 [Pestalotiopsis sp. NC0098]|nr:hypothetical protein BJ166DRAFT_368058 [Pestalotiopsis sp. NC0098]
MMMTRPWRHLFSLSLPFGPLILLSSPFLRWVGLFAAHRPRLAEGRVWRQRYGCSMMPSRGYCYPSHTRTPPSSHNSPPSR